MAEETSKDSPAPEASPSEPPLPGVGDEGARNTKARRRRKHDRPRKDKWDIIEIVAKAAIPLALAVVGFILHRQIESAESENKVQIASARDANEERLKKLELALQNSQYQSGQDLQLMIKVQEVYAQPTIRRLTSYFIRRISDQQLRWDLRVFVFWDLLEQNIARKFAGSPVASLSSKTQPSTLPSSPEISPGFTFNPDADDWHLFGEIVADMSNDHPSGTNFDDWYLAGINGSVPNRWIDQRPELDKLFRFVCQWYLGGVAKYTPKFAISGA